MAEHTAEDAGTVPQFEVGLRAPEGTSPDATEIIGSRLAARIRELPEVAYTLVSVADDPARTQNAGTVYVRLTPVEDRKRDQFEVMKEVRTRSFRQSARRIFARAFVRFHDRRRG